MNGIAGAVLGVPGAPADAAATAAVEALAAQVAAAAARGACLRIAGGRSKRRLLGAPVGDAAEIDTAALSAILAYEPAELVVTALAGTPLADLESALAARGQVLGCEPPRTGAGTTVGGAVSCGWSGPARPWRGALRDHVLGCALVNGRGEHLAFGGQVMKNVAGFDVSRLVTGAQGSLGLLTRISLRVQPRPAACTTARWRVQADGSRERRLALARKPWPVTACCADGQWLRVRLAGSAEAVADALSRLAPDAVVDDDAWWDGLRDFTLPELVAGDLPLWRLALPPAAPDLPDLPTVLWDWGGAQRWLRAPLAAGPRLDAHCRQHGGHASCLAPGAPPASLAPALAAVNGRVRAAFDPAGVFAPVPAATA